MANPDDMLAAVVSMSLEGLSDEELAQLHFGVTWGDGKSKEHCKDRPWFPKVKDFFTEAEGQEVHDATREAIGRVVNLRLSK